MLEADIRISTFSAVPAGSVTHTNQNSFGDFLFAAHKFKMIHNLKKKPHFRGTPRLFIEGCGEVADFEYT